MPRLTPVCWQVLEKIFVSEGFTLERQAGDHRVYVKKGVNRPIVIPKYKEIGADIIQANMRTAGMSRKRYLELLKNFK